MYNLSEIKYSNFLRLLLVIILLVSTTGNSKAFNEFQIFMEEKAKKQLNCTYCHSHPNGPEGNEEGQLDSLTEDEKKLTAYNQYLAGNTIFVNSPILNEFGNYLVKKLGYEEIVKAQNEPTKIIEGLKDSDFDKDGIIDSTEITEGTLSNDPYDGSPLRLFVHNFKKNIPEILLQIISAVVFIFSIFKLKNG